MFLPVIHLFPATKGAWSKQTTCDTPTVLILLTWGSELGGVQWYPKTQLRILTVRIATRFIKSSESRQSRRMTVRSPAALAVVRSRGARDNSSWNTFSLIVPELKAEGNASSDSCVGDRLLLAFGELCPCPRHFQKGFTVFLILGFVRQAHALAGIETGVVSQCHVTLPANGLPAKYAG